MDARGYVAKVWDALTEGDIDNLLGNPQSPPGIYNSCIEECHFVSHFVLLYSCTNMFPFICKF
jgi:hypothetical protein